jgi:hypothetical protein
MQYLGTVFEVESGISLEESGMNFVAFHSDREVIFDNVGEWEIWEECTDSNSSINFEGKHYEFSRKFES